VHLVGPVMFGPVGIDTHERHDMVVVLNQHPATGAKGVDHPLDYFDPGGQME
jgi:hypothetical protein